ncbi:hypothetical protein TNCV_4092571 [Trichonephila clavipes]|nr:hypothetical protein TNCV_4092571 [Trichonephila clavipes]
MTPDWREYRRMNPFEICKELESQLHQQLPDLNQQRDRKTAQSNDKRQKQKEPKKKATDPPPDETDNDKCRHHKEIQKFVDSPSLSTASKAKRNFQTSLTMTPSSDT